MLIDVLTLFVASAAVIGNSLVCHIILHSKCVKKSAFNYVLLNLAILDVITTILAVYKASLVVSQDGLAKYAIKTVYNQSHVGEEIMCKIKQSFRIGSRATPTFLLLIAYERYQAIVKPLSILDREVTNRKLEIAVSLSWMLGIITTVAFLVSSKVGIKGCNTFFAQWFIPLAYSTAVVVLGFILPTVVMSVLYYKVIKAIKRDEQLGLQAAVQRAREASRRKVMAIILTVTVLFYIFCGIPQLVYITRGFFKWRPWNNSVQTLLYSINSLSNPLIYFIFLKTFRMGLKSIFKCAIWNNATLPVLNRKSESAQVASLEKVVFQDKKQIELLNINELPKR